MKNFSALMIPGVFLLPTMASTEENVCDPSTATSWYLLRFIQQNCNDMFCSPNRHSGRIYFILQVSYRCRMGDASNKLATPLSINMHYIILYDKVWFWWLQNLQYIAFESIIHLKGCSTCGLSRITRYLSVKNIFNDYAREYVRET